MQRVLIDLCDVIMAPAADGDVRRRSLDEPGMGFFPGCGFFVAPVTRGTTIRKMRIDVYKAGIDQISLIL